MASGVVDCGMARSFARGRHGPGQELSGAGVSGLGPSATWRLPPNDPLGASYRSSSWPHGPSRELDQGIAASTCSPTPLAPNRADIFGRGIRKFRNTGPAAKDTEALDWRKIEEHDWVLTTYETLADYQTSFARILFSVGVFDEIQKIKDPGTLNSASSKSVNAEFVLGLSGTPVENRIEDLWSVMDRVAPGFLRGSRSSPSTTETRNRGL